MKIKLISLIVISSAISFTHALSIEKGIGVNETNEVKIWNESIPYAIVDQGLDELKDNNDYTVAFFELSEVVYGLSSKLKVTYVNKQDRKLLNHWPLTPWPYRQLPSPIIAAHNDYAMTSPIEEIVEYNRRLPFAGCFNQTPLRYGNIEQDGDKELVLFLNGELIVFSPKYERTVFSTYFQADDWWRGEMEEAHAESDSQQWSDFLLMNNVVFPAFRYYSKIYLGDFNKNGQPDILVWSKTYKSNKKNEQAGFHLIENNLQHYERDLTAQQKSEAGITGEYLPQETSPETIQNWLSSNNLTWQKGFPSKSECAGEEGKLIPEMHDVLLNDPDVLK